MIVTLSKPLRRTACECPNMEKIFSIDFKLGQHLLDSGKEIRGVNFRHCNELDVKLNLREIDATNYPINCPMSMALKSDLRDTVMLL